MKPRINLSTNKFWFNLGWYSGEEFAMFKIELFGCLDGKLLTIFNIQITKFFFGFGLS